MFNIFKKKKAVKEQPKIKVGSYRIRSQGRKHTVEQYTDFNWFCEWMSLTRATFDTPEKAKQWIKEREDRLNAPVTYTEVNIDEL